MSIKEQDLIVVLVTAPSKEAAETLAGALVGAKEAACVNIVPGITSIYNWKGRRESSEEVLLVIKSRRELFAALEKTVRANHPYEVPEIVAIPASRVSEAYLNWVAGETAS
jgi:periplasmic divalent cation tolerance protein